MGGWGGLVCVCVDGFVVAMCVLLWRGCPDASREPPPPPPPCGWVCSGRRGGGGASCPPTCTRPFIHAKREREREVDI